MVLGHTPVDSAFTAYGLLGAGQVMAMLLSFPVISLLFIVALVGFFRAVLAVTEQGSAGPFFTFLVFNLGTFFFFADLGPISIGDVTSAAEDAGGLVTRTTAEDFPQTVASVGDTSKGLLLFTRAINGVVFGATRLVNEDFITAPMALARAVTSATEWRIGDEKLTEEMTTFKEQCYDPALTVYARELGKLSEEGSTPFDPDAFDWNEIWPGSSTLFPFYNRISSTGFPLAEGRRVGCLAWWQAIRTSDEMQRELTIFREQQMNPLLRTVLSGFAIPPFADSEEEILKLMTRTFIRDPVTGRGASEFRAARKLNIGDELAQAFAETTNRFSLGTRATMIMAYGPYVQGGALAVLLYLFPLVLPFVLVSGWGRWVIYYFLALSWVRSWSIGWALADQMTAIAAFSVTDADATMHDNFLRMADAAPLVSSVLYIAAPLLLGVIIASRAGTIASALGFAGLHVGSFIAGGVRAATLVLRR